jgi:hypothetical protein
MHESTPEKESVEAARLRAVWAALDKANALNPGSFKTGQGHLPPAFREVNFRAAFKALIDIVNEIEAASGYADRRAPRATCDHGYPPANPDGTCPSCGKSRLSRPVKRGDS